ncbi:TetR/AcrR family transcriptional regulator [Streptomyces sp. NPDC087212]|uniref:TetR/AcrR family transcriptional regulator n=1 Tax=Streptomyces sp. NPDC087212 TaxID=3365766 RepID=UPI0038102B8A
MTMSLRERKKAATREALHNAAVRLAVQNGVESLTVEAIADAAMVSRRTFSNYFAGKEQALLHRDRARVSVLAALVRAVPEREPLRAALVSAVEQIAVERAADPELEAQYQALRLHPALITEYVATYTAVEPELADAIAERLPVDPNRVLRSRVLAATFLTVLRVSAHQLFAHDERAPQDLVNQAITALREDFR